MAHFYGTLQGSRGQATRGGTKGSGLDVIAASWQGAISTHLYHDDESGEDHVIVQMIPWHGSGETKTLYEGPVGRFEP